MLLWVLSFTILVSSDNSVPIYKYSIINTYKHSSKDYTQGLEYLSNDILIQSAGEYGRSRLQKLNFPSMSIIKEYKLDPSFFAEGITILNNKIYQLTWLEKKMFVYSTDLVLLDVIIIKNPILQGWGICNDGIFLYISDGSSFIYKMDPNSYKILSSIKVHQGTKYIVSINELEWVNGEIWANIYYSKYFIRINPDNGNILAWVNLTGLEANEDAFWYGGYVLNGIAVYDQKIFVTGKCWEHLYEIELVYYQNITDVPKY
ncbi:hypothetical protein SteCoe_23130 [Stentor coeruleus]|uniref:Glutamine cyclotransferase n=1 Tax=Stentor coeruleus TaxID=5963 RepID=A0A1R2BL98_9CILI|nr:hypothetical protein SteCoe_23130 [Stentor coeruleus]